LPSSVAPDLGVLVGIRQQVQETVLDTQGGLQTVSAQQGQDTFSATRQTLEQVCQADTANIALKAHLVELRIGARRA